MPKKKFFEEQEDIREEVDGGVTQEDVPLMEETKVEPRRKSTRKSIANSTTIQSESGATGETTRDTAEKGGTYRGRHSFNSDRSDTGEPSDTETGEDDDMVLKGQHSAGGRKPTASLEGPDPRRDPKRAATNRHQRSGQKKAPN